MNLSLAGQPSRRHESDRQADHSIPLPAATVVLAGGGSGGHISPGLAIAERLIERSARSRAVFACSERAIDADMLRAADAEFFPIPAAPASLHPRRLVRFLARYSRARRTAAEVLRTIDPNHVVALGGFVAAPVVGAAVRLGVPVTLVNLDAQPGRANRWMARQATRVLSAVETPSAPAFARRIERIVGMPLRRIALAPAEPGECRRQLGLDPQRPTLLVTGASQGATSLNRLLLAI
ncbi:MAG: glycosyltransferase, partial [Phycisphaerales bacterium]|nr:glycosyltransferase [Phycisphaerales bacterium]